MLSKTKYEDIPDLKQLASVPIYRALFCPQHGYVFQYRCLHQQCDSFICGKIECVDQHFHNNNLSIEKFNVSPLVSKIQRLEEISSLPEIMMPVITQLRETIEQLKDKGTTLFKLYKEYRKTGEYLHDKIEAPISIEYLKAIDYYQEVKERIEGEISSLGLQINWKNIWNTLEDELQIIQKLKADFPQFKKIYFEQYFIGQQQLTNKWNLLEGQTCEGIIILYFTHEQYVLGQYLSNNDVEACRLFIPNFVFVVNLKGEIHKYLVNNEAITVFTVSSQDQSQQYLKVVNQNISQREEFSELSIRRTVSFRSFTEGQ